MDAKEWSLSVSEHIKGLVRSGDIWTALLQDNGDTVRVSFGHHAKRLYELGSFFQFFLAASVDKTQLIFLFPHDRHVIDTGKTRNIVKINREINEHLGSNPKFVQMVVCMGDLRYKIRGVPRDNDTKLYFQWATKLRILQKSGTADWPRIPVLFATDGHFKRWATFPMFGKPTDRCFVAHEKQSYVFPGSHVMWCCDSEVPTPAPEHTALPAAQMTILAERDMVPDHELAKYKLLDTVMVDTGLPSTPDVSSVDRERYAVSGPSDEDEDDETRSDDWKSVTVTPTPRVFVSPDAPQSVLMRGFFDLDDDAPPVAEDFQLEASSPFNATPTPAATLVLAVQFVAPQDSTSRRGRQQVIKDAL
jgi:hypothetical protein